MKTFLLAWLSANIAVPAYTFATSHDAAIDFNNPLTYVNTGALAIVFWAFATGQIYNKSTVERLITERDRAEETKAEALTALSDKVIPLAEQYNQVLIPSMKEWKDVTDRVRTLLETSAKE